MTRPSTVAAGLALALLAGAAAAQPVVSYTKPGARFEDVRDDLKQAIESRGFVIDYQAQIGKMLERTGKDLGATKPVYADAQSLQFCGAQLSRKLMEADPANVVLCPFTLVVYATADKPQQVVVAYRRPMRSGAGAATRAALRELDVLLDGVAREAVGRPAGR
jgi:uncharacterized protein (DUF302 family)